MGEISRKSHLTDLETGKNRKNHRTKWIKNQTTWNSILCCAAMGAVSIQTMVQTASVRSVIKKKQQPPTNMPASLAPRENRDTPMGGPGAMASLSIDEDPHVQTSTTSTSPAKTSNVDTALPT